MRELAWVKALPHITHWHGFSPGDGEATGEGVGARSSPSAFPSLRAPAARPGPATCVDADVPLQSAGVRELPLAVDAHVGLLPAVDPKVPLEVPCGGMQEGPREHRRGGGGKERRGVTRGQPGQPRPYLRW